MSHDGDQNLGPRERAAAGALRALPEPQARAEFRSELREQFVAGAVGAAAGGAESGHGSTRSGAKPAVGASRRVVPLFAYPLALAAVLAGLVVVFNGGPGWVVSGDGRIEVAGQAYDAFDSSLEKVLRPGVEVEALGKDAFQLTSAGQLKLEVAPGSRLTLPNPPARWFGRRSELNVEHGEIRITTGEEFHGAQLQIHAPSAMIDVTGTTLAVIANPCTTCVCVLEGEVGMMEQGTSEMMMVPGGMRRSVFDNGRDPVEEEILPMERMKLTMFRDAAADDLKREGDE